MTTTFEWANPWWFAALPLALLPLVAAIRPHAVRFSALGPGHVQPPVRAGRSWRTYAVWIVPALEVAALALVFVALARPRLVQHETVRESDGIDILMAIDTSGSMDEPDMGPALRPISRLEAARLVMTAFANERQWDRLGLLVFGQEAFLQVPLTLDHEGLVDFIGQLESGVAGRNRTAIGDAIAVAARRMKDLDAPSKIVILVTDGQSNAGSVTPSLAAEAAAALGVRVYTIAVGNDRLDDRQLKAIAATTGGRSYRARDVNALAGVYAEIDQLEKSTAQVKEYTWPDEYYLYALLPALGCFVGQWLLSTTVLRRLP